MGMFDLFSSSLICPVCGTISSQEMQTIIRDDPDWSYLHVGDSLKITQELAELADYKTLQLPQLDELIQLLSVWDGGFCPSCGYQYNWGRVSVQNNVIQEISHVQRSKDVLIHGHFIDTDCIWGLASDAGYVQKDPISGSLAIVGLDFNRNLLDTLISLVEMIENDKKASKGRLG
jgi:hypothetical protein